MRLIIISDPQAPERGFKTDEQGTDEQACLSADREQINDEVV
jgi:hypothetical protein